MQLQWLAGRLDRRLSAIEAHTSSFLSRSTIAAPSVQELYELEGICSDAWQVWGRFCRNAVVASSLGCTTGNGRVLPATFASWENVSYVACKQQGGRPPSQPGTNNMLFREPTWGRLHALLDVIRALSPSNGTVLLAAFGSIPDLDHLRIIRNACAHRNSQTFQEVLALAPSYRATKIRHPLQALFWTDPSSGGSLFSTRISDMRIAAGNACL